MSERMFPVQGSGSNVPGGAIPWGIIAPHENAAWMNHGQTLETLARRAGLGWIETLAVLLDVNYGKARELVHGDSRAAMVRVQKIIESRRNRMTIPRDTALDAAAALRRREAASGEALPRSVEALLLAIERAAEHA